MKFFRLSQLIALVFSACIITACSKKSGSNPTPTPPIVKPAISSLSVTTGPYGTSVVINGTGFSGTQADDQVTFNGKPGTLTTVSTTQITATVPLGAGTGNVSVTVNGNTAVGPVFTYQLSQIVSLFAGSGTQAYADGTGAGASFNTPLGLAFDATGNLYVADLQNQAIRKITPSGVVSTFAGGSYGFTNGIGGAAQFYNPYSVAVDAAGDIYVADEGNFAVRKITSLGLVSTVSNSFYNPLGVAVDASGNVYVTDTDNNLVKKITPDGKISTLAGKYGTIGNTDGVGTQASFDNPSTIVVDGSGNVFVVSSMTIIRKITPTGTVTTFAGGGAGIATDGQGTQASFGGIRGLALDAAGDLYASDSINNSIREITPGGLVTTIAGTGKTAGMVTYPCGLAISKTGNIFFSNALSNKIMKISFQ